VCISEAEMEFVRKNVVKKTKEKESIRSGECIFERIMFLLI
jgi:hypothetical protein